MLLFIIWLLQRRHRTERVITIHHYYEVQAIRYDKVEQSVVFRGEPQPVMHRRHTDRIIAYTGLSAHGEPQEFRGIANFPQYQVVDLGELPDPKFAIGQKLDFPRNKTKRPRRVVRILWQGSGWVYLGRAVDYPKDSLNSGKCLITEGRMNSPSAVTLLDD